MNHSDLNFSRLGKIALISCAVLVLATSLAVCTWCEPAFATEEFCQDPNDVRWEDYYPPFDKDPYKTKPIEPYFNVDSADDSKLAGGKSLMDLVPANTVSLTLDIPVSRKMISELTGLRRLRWFEIASNDVSDGLAAIHKLNGLEYVYLGRHCEVGASDFRDICRLKKLKALQFNTNVENSDLLNLRRCPELRDLQALRINLSDAGMRYVAECPKLQRLLVGRCSISGDGWDCLSKLHQLRSLIISNPHFTNDSAVHIRNLRTLCVLGLSSPSIGDTMLPGISQLEDLKVLMLADTQVSDQGVESITKLMRLSHLDLSGTNVTDVGVAALTSLDRLEALYLNKTKLTTKTFDYILSLPNLTTVGIPDSLLHSPELKKLAGLPKLQVLRIDELYHPTDPAQEELLATLKTEFPGVEVRSFNFGFGQLHQELEPKHDMKEE